MVFPGFSWILGLGSPVLNRKEAVMIKEMPPCVRIAVVVA